MTVDEIKNIMRKNLQAKSKEELIEALVEISSLVALSATMHANMVKEQMKQQCFTINAINSNFTNCQQTLNELDLNRGQKYEQ